MILDTIFCLERAAFHSMFCTHKFDYILFSEMPNDVTHMHAFRKSANFAEKLTHIVLIIIILMQFYILVHKNANTVLKNYRINFDMRKTHSFPPLGWTDFFQKSIKRHSVSMQLTYKSEQTPKSFSKNISRAFLRIAASRNVDYFMKLRQ